MAIRFNFEYEGINFVLPVNPETFQVKTSGNNRVENVVNLGEINILRERKLKTVRLQSFFPEALEAAYVVDGAQDREFYIAIFNRMLNDKPKKPALFVVEDSNLDSFLVSIEAFDYSETWGNGDISYSIDLKEYKRYFAKKITIENVDINNNTAEINENPNRVDNSNNILIGSEVIVNGQVFRDSFGNGGGITLSNYRGKINYIKTDGRSHPYHVTDLNGGYLGWVTSDNVRVAQ